MADAALAYPQPRGEPPSAAVVHAERPQRGVALKIFLVALFLMPLQIDVDSFREAIDTRIPPGDLVLLVAVLAAPTVVKFRRTPTMLLPLGLLVALGYGAVVALLHAGDLSNHSVVVKLLGAVVLVVWCLVTATHVARGHELIVMKVWLAGMVFWGFAAWLDWKYVNVLPFQDVKITSRFGGTQYDPNNAGAAYAVAVVVMWRYGRRAFPRRWVRVLASVWLLVAFALTLSRGGFIGLGVAVAVVLLATRVGMTRWLRYTVAAMVGLAALAATGFIASAVDDFQSRPDNVGQRGNLIGDGLDSLADSYGVGIGLGTFRVEYGEIIHNTAIWFLVEMSIIGVIYFIALCVVPFQSAIRLRPYDRDLALALLGAHVVMVVASVGIEAVYQRNWWVIIGVIGGAGARHEAQMRRPADAVPARSSRR